MAACCLGQTSAVELGLGFCAPHREGASFRRFGSGIGKYDGASYCFVFVFLAREALWRMRAFFFCVFFFCVFLCVCVGWGLGYVCCCLLVYFVFCSLSLSLSLSDICML